MLNTDVNHYIKTQNHRKEQKNYLKTKIIVKPGPNYMNARPPKRLTQLRSISHALVPTLQKHQTSQNRYDLATYYTLQRQLG